MDAKKTIVDGINGIPELELWGEPELSLLSFGSHTVDMMAVADGVDDRGWFSTRLGGPPSIHCRLTPAHDPSKAESRPSEARTNGGLKTMRFTV